MNERSRTSGRRFLPIAAVVLTVAACSSSNGSGDQSESVTVDVTPQTSAIADPVTIKIDGLDPEIDVTLKLESTDGQDVQWASETTYQTDTNGTLTLDVDDTEAEIVNPISAMTMTESSSSPTPYFWSGEPQAFSLTVIAEGQEEAQAQFQRGVPLGEPAQMTTIAGEGFTGNLWMPPDGVNVQTPAIVNIEGSAGGLLGTIKAAALAAEGYPVLDVAYFQGPLTDDPDLPDTLSEIPLEYFTEAIGWLAEQRQIDSDQIWVMGTSRGSEAALLLGSKFPEMVSGVVAVVPSSVAICSFPGCSGPAWTLEGEPVPFSKELSNPEPTDEAKAVIAVEDIDGPVLVVCATEDKIWDSCAHADAIDARLAQAGDAFPHELITQDGAGHSLGQLVPYQPKFVEQDPQLTGASEAADQIARAQTWPQVLDFLQSAER